MNRILATATAAATAGAVLLVFAPSAAATAAPHTPDYVDVWFDEVALPFIMENAASTVYVGELSENETDFTSATDIGHPREYSAWSDDFVRGRATERPVKATGLWIAPVVSGDTVIGTVHAHADTASQSVEFVGYNNNAELGNALIGLSQAARVIEDQPSATWIVLENGRVRTLTEQGRFELPEETSLGEYQSTVAKRYAAAMAASEGVEDAVGGGGPAAPSSALSWWGIASVAAIIVGGLALVSLGYHRRKHGDRSPTRSS